MPTVLKFALVALVLAAAIYDFRFRRIPNWLNLSGLILGLGLNTYLFAQYGLITASLGALLALVLYIPLNILRAMGAGDVKLMAAVGAIVGPQNWMGILIYTALAGGVLAIVVALSKGRLQRTLLNVAVVGRELMHFRSPASRHEALDVRNEGSLRLPHGVAIAAGCLAFLILNPMLHH